MLKKGLKLLLVCGVFVVSAGVGQFSQFMYSNSDVREYNLAQWAGSDAEKQQTIKAFSELCLIEKQRTFTERVENPISIHDCALEHGFDKEFKVIKRSDTILTSYAWPLSLLPKLPNWRN